jgi:hypothetical protein
MANVEDGLPQEVKDSLKGCSDSLDALEEVLGPLLSTPWDVLTARLEPLEKAKLNLMIAYSVESLYFIYLKTQVLQDATGQFSANARHASLHDSITSVSVSTIAYPEYVSYCSIPRKSPDSPMTKM